ncbi:MAG: DUF3467 domain-containing protein [Blastocatellia bacterium]|nr:DUF3467 domain-containing protein [Blastocatellia bacterium]
MAGKDNDNAKETEREIDELEPNVIERPLNFVIPPGFGLVFANNVFIQHSQDEFIISFFQTDPPAIIDQKELEQVKSINAYCVARIVLTPNEAFKFFNALGRNLQKYREVYLKSQERGEEE